MVRKTHDMRWAPAGWARLGWMGCGAVLVVLASAAQAQQCGDAHSGDCCIENSTPACEDAACCGTVCAADPFCCNTLWDQLCADQAMVLCAPGTCPGACPGQGDCCSENNSPGCDDPSCCATVCAADAFCCETLWDQLCADQAAALCSPGTCPGVCPGEGDCCVENGKRGCNDAPCCTTVCASDPTCCDLVWDASCAALAGSLCAPGTCPGACPGEGDCCIENGTPGCNDAGCCATVCASNPACCDAVWDASCAALAQSMCAPGTCPGVCPGEGDCCIENGTPGCNDASCCATVCASNPACCDAVWDASCAALAQSMCAPGTCPGVCPGEGDCCTENGTPGCDDAACCATVCASNPACCDAVWDASCAALAGSLCAPGTCPGACPGEGDCCIENGTPGCNDAACCTTVCASNPACCDAVWDASCATLAQSLCAPGTCPGACPGEGECCVENGRPGCLDAACCNTVCTSDPFCCDVIWDQQCADQAVAVCDFPVLCFGDFDDDGDAGLTDHSSFFDCFAGPGVLPRPTPPTDILECLQAFDVQGDNDVDLFDFRYFMNVFTGEL